MRKTVWPVFGVALMVTGCGGPGVPQPGDQVKPAFSQNIDWEAGQKGELWVRLQATNTEGKTRGLSFPASRKNPVAVVQFYDQNQQRLSSEDVELSERC
jgi:hypothetical protein